MAENIQNL